MQLLHFFIQIGVEYPICFPFCSISPILCQMTRYVKHGSPLFFYPCDLIYFRKVLTKYWFAVHFF